MDAAEPAPRIWTESAPRVWSWEHPRESPRRQNLGKLEPIDMAAPYGREQLSALDLQGVQFAEWKSFHPGCLDTDIIGLVDDSGLSTEPGSIYRLGGESYFIQLDARERLPFQDRCLAWVYAEHLVEHLSLADGIRWLSEVRRVLEPGGLIRLTTPDLRTYLESYLSPEGGMFAHHREVLWEHGARPRMPVRPAFMVNLVFYYWGHRWIYDFEELRYALERAGFPASEVRRHSFGQGALPDVAAMDRPRRQHETMYVEARVP
jgi:predicted SAM-dependent methyltransferase